jgi:hypothetical protein
MTDDHARSIRTMMKILSKSAPTLHSKLQMDGSDILQTFEYYIPVNIVVYRSRTSETSVNFYQTTRRNNAEDSHLHTCRRENLKSHKLRSVLQKTLWKFPSWRIKLKVSESEMESPCWCFGDAQTVHIKIKHSVSSLDGLPSDYLFITRCFHTTYHKRHIGVSQCKIFPYLKGKRD